MQHWSVIPKVTCTNDRLINIIKALVLFLYVKSVIIHHNIYWSESNFQWYRFSVTETITLISISVNYLIAVVSTFLHEEADILNSKPFYHM